MVSVPELYGVASRRNIPVVTYPLPQTGSLAVMYPSGDCVIGMDPGLNDGGVRERIHLAHELGHCATGSFYNIYAKADTRQRHENKADKWAIEALISVDDLDDAIAAGYTEIWELADFFGVPEDFMRKAVCYYVHGNLCAELYF